MESSSSTTRFKFRDHQDMDATALSEASSDMSSVSSDRVDIHHDEDGVEDDSDLQSMTAKVPFSPFDIKIRHLFQCRNSISFFSSN